MRNLQCLEGLHLTKKVETDRLAPEMTVYREKQIGNTLYRVTSVYTGEKELGGTLEQLAVRKVLNEIQQGSRAALR